MRFLLLFAACSGASSEISGTVTVAQNSASWAATASFVKTGAPYATRCRHDAGSCELFDFGCAKNLPPQPDPTFLSAGTITIDGGMHLVLMQGSDGRYVMSGTGLLFIAGAEIVVTASGKEVRTFSGRVTLPSSATLDPIAATLPRDRDLEVSWSGGSDGAQFGLLVFTDANPALQINCSFDAAAHGGAIPASLLGLIPAGSLAHVEATGVTATSSAAPGIDLQGGAQATGLATTTFN
jgi:hypothetical protein